MFFIEKNVFFSLYISSEWSLLLPGLGELSLFARRVEQGKMFQDFRYIKDFLSANHVTN